MKGKISFIIHGKIRKFKSLQKAAIELLAADFQVAFYPTHHARHAEELTLQALEEGCEYLIAIGGDGTLSEMVNAYLSAGGRKAYETVLGVLPAGTGNDFVKSLGENHGLHDLVNRIQNQSIQLLDAGQIQFNDKSGERVTRYFDNIADLGIGAEVVARVNGVNLRKIILGGTLVFFLTALQTFLTYRHKKVSIRAGDFSWSGRILSIVIANGRFFGSGLGIAPDARMNDGLFELVIFGDLSVWDYLKNYGRLRQSQKIPLQAVQYLKVAEVRVIPEQSQTVAEADGEVVGYAPMEFQCLPEALPFLTS